jgi:small-conductance mechanosensitive channel
MLRAAIHSAIATVVYVIIVWLLLRFGRWVTFRTLKLANVTTERLKVGGGTFIQRHRAIRLAHGLLRTGGFLLILLVSYEWLGFVLGRFPYTRVWSEHLNTFLVETTLDVLVAIAHAIPEFAVAVVIFVIAHSVNRLQRGFFDAVQMGRIHVGWVDKDTAPATRRLAALAIWLFAAVMAYPYIPGSSTDAFKGLSVLLGLMVSVGASGLVGQAASGLILMYTRTFRTGDYVRIGDAEGTVFAMGLFTTRVRTGMGDELSIPNATVLGTVTRNYSHEGPRPGFMLEANVTIGYDVAWRQVRGLMVAAARAIPEVSHGHCTTRARHVAVRLLRCLPSRLLRGAGRRTAASRRPSRRCTARSSTSSTSTACRSCRRTTWAIRRRRRSCRKSGGTRQRQSRAPFPHLHERSTLARLRNRRAKHDDADRVVHDMEARGPPEVVPAKLVLQQQRAHALEDVRAGQHGGDRLHPGRQHGDGVIHADTGAARKMAAHAISSAPRPARRITDDTARPIPSEGDEQREERDQREAEREDRVAEQQIREHARAADANERAHQLIASWPAMNSGAAGSRRGCRDCAGHVRRFSPHAITMVHASTSSVVAVVEPDAIGERLVRDRDEQHGGECRARHDARRGHAQSARSEELGDPHDTRDVQAQHIAIMPRDAALVPQVRDA